MPFGTVKAQTYLSFKDAITPIAKVRRRNARTLIQMNSPKLQNILTFD
jgi:hypothetical protein